jgi:DoxX-like family
MQMTTATMNVQGAAETNEQTGAAIAAATQNSVRRKATVGTWIGRVMSGLVIAFMLMASAFPKLFMPELATESMQQLGWNAKHLLIIAVLELVGTLLYAIPRTAALGAVLLTGLLGGAVATHLRVDNPLFSHTVFPLYVGLLMWGGLWLRNAKVRALLPL